MIKQRIMQLLVIALCFAVTIGCKHEAQWDSSESKIEEADTIKTVMKADSAMTDTSSVHGAEKQDSTTIESSVSESKETEVKQTEAAANDSATANEAQNKKNGQEKADPTHQEATPTPQPMPQDSINVDTTVVDSLWRRLLEDVKIVSDTTLNQADSESVNRDSLLEVAKKEKLDSLVIGVIKPTNHIDGGTPVSGSWPWWMTVLAGVVGLLLGGLLTWLISKLKRKEESSSNDEKETKLKLKIQDFSDLVDDDKNKRLLDFYKRMIIKKDK